MFDPEKVRRLDTTDDYAEDDPNGRFVSHEDYDQLLEQYKLLLGRPETRQLCTKHQWLDTNGQLPCWPPIKIYKCGLCNLTGNLQGRLLTPSGFPQYDLSDMTYEGCPENGQTK